MGIYSARRFVRALAVATAVTLAAGVTAISAPIAASAASPTTGTATSVPYTAGKAQGSGKWGVVGDVKTLEPSTTFTYGVDINPVTGSLTTSDSGKVIFSSFVCRIFGLGASPCQQGTPSIADYALLGGTPSAIGSTDVPATEYTGAGAYSVTGEASATRTRNTGIGQLYGSFADRTDVDFGATAQQGPRGIAHTSDGVAWVVNSEAVAPLDGPAGAIRRFDANLNEIAGAGWTGAWADRDRPGVHFYRTGIDTAPDGSVLVNSEVSDRFQRYDSAGTFVGSVLLDLPGPVYRNPYSVAVDKVDGSMYVPLINFRDTPAATPFLEKRNSANEVIGQFTSSALEAGQVVFSAEVEPRTQHVFAWSQNGAVVEWDKDGNEVGVYRDGTTPGTFPGLTTTRGMTFDANGRMYLSVAEGTDSTRVMILGKTPEPVTSVCSTLSADRTSASFTIECASGPGGTAAPYQQTQLLDYVIEASTDGGATWQVLPKDAGVSAQRTQSVSGLSPTADYTFRVSPWNEAGNGDWITSTPLDYTAANVAFAGAENSPITFNALQGDSGSAVPSSVGLVDAEGSAQSTLTVDGEGTYVVNADTTVTFTPTAGFTGAVTPVSIAVTFGDCDVRKQVTGQITKKPRLTLQATVDGGPLTAADVTLSASGPTSGITGVTGDPAVTGALVDAGSYTLGAPTLASYTASRWSCVQTGTRTAIEVSPTDAVALALASDTTCTVTYTFVPAVQPSTPPAAAGPTGAAGQPLALTGTTLPLALGGVGALLLAAGAVAVSIRRARRS